MKKYIVLDKSQVETQKQYKKALHAFEKFSKDPDNKVVLEIVTNYWLLFSWKKYNNKKRRRLFWKTKNQT